MSVPVAKDRSLVRASDIGAWTYCRRAWWLANVQGVAHQNPQVLRQGTLTHHRHGRQVRRGVRLHTAGLILLGVSLLLLCIAVVWLLAHA